MRLKRFFFCWLGIFFIIFTAADGRAENWEFINGKHFVVYYKVAQDSSLAQTVARKAEEYYTRIADQIGYSRYASFWTWEERVKIFIFPDQQAFMQSTGQQSWSRGYANSHSLFLRSRTIVTYRQNQDFIDGLLPHEISHLILKDFVGLDAAVPLWFQEGVAQLCEANKKINADLVMRALIKRNEYIPFDLFMGSDIRQESDNRKVAIFYAQSVSVVDFLIRTYGSSNFGLLCRGFKDTKSFEEAMVSAYGGVLRSVDDLESKWINRMKGP